ncbi:MAG: hypothetical protein J6B87_06960 [Clostridia bacterium]|nr:hypothetical protein [Clostridia bacterium]
MKKILISIIVVALIATGIYLSANSFDSQDIKENVNNKKIKIVTSLEDEISDNAAWCGTFNLIWNDLKNDLAKQDIVFPENSKIVDNLNKGTFTVNDLSEDSYYKTYGRPTLELKAEIEKAIKEKFNETSDILDDFNWGGAGEKDYFLYSMLKKKFEYPKEFSKLENGMFGQYNNVRYFGINGKTKKEVREQIDVLYYNSEDDFALKIKTKGNDEIIVSVGNKEKNFLDIYNDIMSESENYNDGKFLRNNDAFKMPYITFDLKEEITEVENKPFSFLNGDSYVIDKALQTIQFELDEKGGKIKSEAGMSVKATSARPQEPRKFNVDQTFTIFLIEQDKNLPYFAAKISDISSVQNDVQINENSNEQSTQENEGNTTSAYIPDEMQVASKDDVGTKTEQIIINRNKEKVSVEVLLDTVTRNGATIVITDKNENPYGWGKSYKLQQKIADGWYNMAPQSEMIFEEIAYILDENGQFKQDIDWTRFYGELGNGTFRIVKDTYDNKYIDFYSNEFEIK